ncbi:MAG TPA: histidine triad nucleotide-binding protein [Candidatus Dormibacteraeota bacterium]|nr:histidine triad nucleotide-binding protein [Candidatus Dormibacteraeota bacterium]
MDCIFCDIIAGNIPSNPVYQDEDVIAINDINPQAPVHRLVIPKKHFADVTEIERAEDGALLAKLFATASRLGRQSGGGFRLVVNTGAEGGQTVDHAHIHVLSGRFMEWPPG